MRDQIISLGGQAGAIADAGSVQSGLVKASCDLGVQAVSFEAGAAMVHGGTGVVVDLYRVRAAASTKVYSYTFSASSVAWTPVSLVAESVTNAGVIKDGDRLYAVVTNGTGASVTPGTWAVHVELNLGIEPPTTERYAT